MQQFFKNFTREHLKVEISLAEIETVERIGIDPEFVNVENETSQLPPRPLLIYLSNGHTAKKLLKASIQVTNPVPNGVLFVPDKARGWVNFNQIAEHCTGQFQIKPGKMLETYGKVELS